jgi:site-specific DNA-methyltransferase (adenine-specific)
MSYRIINGDSAKELKKFKDNSIDAVITDPPYGIEFLAKEWDQNTGAVEIWSECLRVLKPGGFLLAFSAARTYHILATNIQSVGFEIRDQIMWLYASGFPKAQKIKGFPGWKTQLKPAHEPICMARKPVKGPQYKNMAKYGVGALNIDESRIPYMDAGKTNLCIPQAGRRTASFSFGHKPTQSGGDGSPEFVANDKGRFPSNVIGEVEGYQQYYFCPKVSRKERNIGCEDREAKPLFKDRHKDAKALGSWADKRDQAHKNNHPTVKPIALMKYLIKLVAPQGSHILDPFAGSGTTGMAAKELGYKFTGIEIDANYVDICIRRIEATKTDPKHTLFK